jgi:hypothetical protein
VANNQAVGPQPSSLALGGQARDDMARRRVGADCSDVLTHQAPLAPSFRGAFGCFFEAVGFAVDCDDLGVVDSPGSRDTCRRIRYLSWHSHLPALHLGADRPDDAGGVGTGDVIGVLVPSRGEIGMMPPSGEDAYGGPDPPRAPLIERASNLRVAIDQSPSDCQLSFGME